jgi:hypothetical protein
MFHRLNDKGDNSLTEIPGCPEKRIQIPPFSRKWQILPGKYMQVLSISHKMADYFAFPLLL